MSMMRPDQLSIANWRESPVNTWSFQHIRELLPTENIPAGPTASALHRAINPSIDTIQFEGPNQQTWTLPQLCDATHGSALLISQQGKLVHEWYAQPGVADHPQVLFSVSKSIIGTLTGIFVASGQLDVREKVTHYLPEVSHSGFANCTIQQLLDMTTSLAFEDFTDDPAPNVAEYWASTGWSPATDNQQNPGMQAFLLSLNCGAHSHGVRYEYQSPNTDLLGWVLERISRQSIASLLSHLIWQPIQAERDAYITVDHLGAARSAGGICAVPRDLLRFGNMILNQGQVDGRQVIPQQWIEDCWVGGDKTPWLNGNSSERFPDGGYRNYWYQIGNDNGALAAIGLHGQWLYLDPVANLVIVKNSAQTNPLNDVFGPIHLGAFEAISHQLMAVVA